MPRKLPPFLVAPELAPHLDKLLADALTVGQLANLFGFSRRRMGMLLKRTKGAQRMGARWRLPLLTMPPAYFVAVRLLSPAVSIQNAKEIIDAFDLRKDEKS